METPDFYGTRIPVLWECPWLGDSPRQLPEPEYHCVDVLVRRLGIVTVNPVQVDYEQRHARATALRSAEAHMERLYREGLVSAPVWEKLKPILQEQNAILANEVRDLLQVEPSLETEEIDTTRREILRAQHSAYLGMRGDGVIFEEVNSHQTFDES